MRLRNFHILCLVFFALSTIAQAEPERGRLPDGRAFRTDVEGTQIIDYIAELELSVEALQRQIYGLENEIDQKDGTIARLRDQGANGQGEHLKERDLLARKSNQPTSSAARGPAPQDCSQLEQELRAQFARTQDLNNRQVRELQERLDRSKQQIISLEISLNERADQIDSLEENFEARLASLQNELLSTKEARRAAAEEAAVQAERRKALRAEQERLAIELERSKQESLRASQRVAAKAAPSAPPAGRTNGGLSARRNTPTPKAQQSVAGRAAVDSLRGNLNRQYTQLGRLVQHRAKLFKQYSSSENQNSALKVSPQPAVSKRGWSIKEVERRIADANSVQQLATLQRDIAEIEQKLQEDIALVTRLAG